MVLDSYQCSICFHGGEETIEHLFWQCPFAQQCWDMIDLQNFPDSGSTANVDGPRMQINNNFFMMAIILMCWTIWKAGNEIIFNDNQLGIDQCRALFLKEVRLVSCRVKDSLSLIFEQWIQQL